MPISSGAVAATLVRWSCARRATAFSRALDNVAGAQEKTLRRIVRAAASTAYGKSFQLSASDSISAFREKIPVVDYADVQPWIEAQRAGRHEAFSPGRTRCFEPTSGSSGATKHIPYNDALLGAFRSMFAIWAHDLLTHALQPRSGRVFMSVSSPLHTNGGFDDDTQYLGGPLRGVMNRFLVKTPREHDPDSFRDALACSLVAASDLEIVSIWNPSYLLILMEHVETHRERLSSMLPRQQRNLLTGPSISWRDIWPSLQLVSCWTAAAAAVPARRLAELLPHARMQGKGLLATEAPVTLPLSAAGGCVPLVDEVFLEFEDENGRLHPCSDVQYNTLYAVVLTQPGGLLRYRLGDRVRVSGRHRDAPLLEFVGRADAMSDLVGEKLGEPFVERMLQGLVGRDTICTLLPLSPVVGSPRYCLMTDDASAELPIALEQALMTAFRYREARLLKQLDEVQVIARPDMRRKLHDAFVAAGFKAGDIKDRALIPSVELAQRVHAHVAACSSSTDLGVDPRAVHR